MAKTSLVFLALLLIFIALLFFMRETGMVHITNDIACDQSATTTDCDMLANLGEQQPGPWVSPDTAKPIEEWTSATGTPVSFAGYSFTLPPGWHGYVYDDGSGYKSVFVEHSSTLGGFSIECPPPGKGLEGATRLSSETRTLSEGNTTYDLRFEKWTYEPGQPWMFVWVYRSKDAAESSLVCLVQGSTDEVTVHAMSSLYETWSLK